jgi:hypothetical protein
VDGTVSFTEGQMSLDLTRVTTELNCATTEDFTRVMIGSLADQWDLSSLNLVGKFFSLDLLLMEISKTRQEHSYWQCIGT